MKKDNPDRKQKSNHLPRRDFLHRASIAGLAMPFLSLENLTPAPTKTDRLEVHLFSKHLQFLDYEDMAAAAKEMGFDGLDLTVRPGGHVEPEQVSTDLPKAVQAMEKYGLPAKLMTTAIDNAEDPVNRKVLETAAGLGFQLYRTNWLRYDDKILLPEQLQTFQQQMNTLAEFNQQLGLEGAYQNHSGLLVGASLWEVWKLIEKADPAGLGSQYDIRHATVKGGNSWENGLRLIHPRIKTIVLKDFIWEKGKEGWNIRNVPLGEGMVDFTKFFQLLREYKIKVPVSLHLEYELGGAQHGRPEIEMAPEEVFAAMRRDLVKAQALWNQTG